MLLTCRSTVLSLRTSSAAIALLVRPAETSRRTCNSRSVSPWYSPAAARRTSESTRARSGAAPNCSKTKRAASNSISAVSSSPSARQARPTRTRTRAASYGASSSRHPVHARRSTSGGSGIPLGQKHGPDGPGRNRPQQRGVEVSGDLRQLVGCGAGRADVIDREADLDVGGQHPGPGGAVLRLVDDPPDRRRGGRHVALGQPQFGQTGLRAVSRLVGLTVSLLSLGEFPPQPVK